MFNLSVRHHLYDLHLIRNSFQRPSHLIVPLPEAKLRVLQLSLLTEFLDEQRRLHQVVAGKTREEMVRHLEMQTAMEECNGWCTDDIRCCTQLAVDEGLCWAEVGSRAREV